MPNIACPLPSGHDYNSVKAAYNKVKKQMPGLTPAAWRKAAAQELGIDYPTFLKLWKQKPAKAMIPESTPTLPAAAAPKADMGLVDPLPMTYSEIVKKHGMIKIMMQADSIAPEQAVKELTELLDNLAGYTKPVPALAKAIDNSIAKAMAGNIVTDTVKVEAKIAIEAAEDVIDTQFGPLTHNLVKQAFKEVKQQMPGASPAVLRKAAADKLGVDYKDFLKAWKNKTNPSQAIPKTFGPIKNTPLKEAGEWHDKKLDSHILTDELARLYGPKANKQYITMSKDADGVFSTSMPTSILSPQEMNVIAQQLKDMGFDVKKYGNQLKITNEYAKEEAKAAAKALKIQTDQALKNAGMEFFETQGNTVWNIPHANKASDAWWATLNEAQKKAVRYYTGSGYHVLNKWLRGLGGSASAATRDALDAALKKFTVPHDFTVFRGTNSGRGLNAASFKEGGKWIDNGYVSTAITKGSGWGGDLKFEIVVPKGSHGAYVDPHSSHRGEKEFILPRGTEYRVISVSKSGSITTIKMIVVKQPH